ncbi:MAG: MFS transporter [Bacteroidetes bacterium]|nr:MAG: MFS transporter [Bacteroidota bacterium]
MSTGNTGQKPLLTIFFTTFIDLLGVGLIVPIITPLFLQADGVLPPEYDYPTRTFLLGLLIATFPLCQFFSGPFLGSLSDKYGRKPILFASLFVTVAAYLCIALGINTHQLLLVYLGRGLTGAASGNLSVIYSSIADLSSKEDKIKNFGLIGMAFGLGFVIGPALGGILSNPEFGPYFTYSTPFVFSAILAAINLIQIRFNFPETNKSPNPDSVITLTTGFRNIHRAFTTPDLIRLFVIFMFFFLGFTVFTQFFQVYLIQKLAYDSTYIGYLFTGIGVLGAITQGLIVRVLSKKVDSRTLITFVLPILGVGYLITLLPEVRWQVFLTIPFIAIPQGLINPNFSSMVSNTAPPHLQGETLGMLQSVQSVAQIIALLLGGYMAGLFVSAPMWIAFGATMVAWLLFLFGYKRK